MQGSLVCLNDRSTGCLATPQFAIYQSQTIRKKEVTSYFLFNESWQCPIFPGSCPPSIFGDEELNFRVRYENGWDLLSIVTKNGITSTFNSANY